MEEKKSIHIPHPGIAEALHPEIGNGSAWEENLHAFILRSPDPTKRLDEQFDHRQLVAPHISKPIDLQNEIQKPETEATYQEKKEIDTSRESGIKVPDPVFASDEASREIISTESVQDFTSESVPKLKKKSKPKKDGKLLKGDTPEPSISDSGEVEGPKAGKLVRKAAKSVKRQEEVKKQAEIEVRISREMNLSPYTRWLKSLTGSEYVHPYEEDYALNQGTGQSKEGISETFADLLASQGYKEQALEMYMKLMEKYPEKSGFFAAKIEALQQ